MELQLEDFALAPLIDGVVKTVEPLAAKNGNQVARAARRLSGGVAARNRRRRESNPYCRSRLVDTRNARALDG
jgi:hypothetical protein